MDFQIHNVAEWVTEILNKVVGAEEEKEVIEPEHQEVIN